MISPFKPILFLENHPRIRSLFDSFWGLSMVENPLVDFANENDFWESSIDDCALLVVDSRSIHGEALDWMGKIRKQKPNLERKIIWVVETKEERDRITTLGVKNVLRLPFQWNQWLPVICKMGLSWRLWRESPSSIG